ncbi:MAG TPA: hypothetical protein VM734_35935 [Kofleriaceae bacterium]|jgi:hypothetical protein|nr:hypothetical protein [Kofleriaceae bacterium]
MKRLVLLVALAAAAACSSKTTAPTTPSPAAAATASTEPLTKDSLMTYVGQRFPEAVAAGTIEMSYGSGGVENELLEELAIMGIHTVGELAAIVPADYEQRGLPTSPGTTVAGLVRDLLIIHDARGYFAKAWRQSWSATPDDFPAPVAYGVDLDILRAAGVFGDQEGGSADDY